MKVDGTFEEYLDRNPLLLIDRISPHTITLSCDITGFSCKFTTAISLYFTNKNAQKLVGMYLEKFRYFLEETHQMAINTDSHKADWFLKSAKLSYGKMFDETTDE